MPLPRPKEEQSEAFASQERTPFVSPAAFSPRQNPVKRWRIANLIHWLSGRYTMERKSSTRFLSACFTPRTLTRAKIVRRSPATVRAISCNRFCNCSSSTVAAWRDRENTRNAPFSMARWIWARPKPWRTWLLLHLPPPTALPWARCVADSARSLRSYATSCYTSLHWLSWNWISATMKSWSLRTERNFADWRIISRGSFPDWYIRSA